MTDEQLTRLLEDGESDRVERKESFSGSDAVAQAICAFSNDLPNHGQPGVVFVGVRDNGDCANLQITDELLRNLGGLRVDGNILPPPNIEVRRCVLSGCDLAAVIVHPSSRPPVRYQGRTWIRVGPRRAIATIEEERRLAERTRGRDLPFDVRQAGGATLADLDTRRFLEEYLPSTVAREVLEQNERTTEEKLCAVRLATAEDPASPTNLGVLVLAPDPREHIPGAYVQFLRIEGTDLADPIRDEKLLSGPLAEMLRKLRETLEINISTAVDLTSSATEIRWPDYPIAALQQLAFNAVMHRTYEGTNAPVRIYWFSDRIEIHSPGGPFGQVNRENFGQPGVTDYRNPHLAEAMKTLGFVQKFGAGIPTARRELDRNGNPPLELLAEETHILATIRRRP